MYARTLCGQYATCGSMAERVSKCDGLTRVWFSCREHSKRQKGGTKQHISVLLPQSLSMLLSLSHTHKFNSLRSSPHTLSRWAILFLTLQQEMHWGRANSPDSLQIITVVDEICCSSCCKSCKCQVLTETRETEKDFWGAQPTAWFVFSLYCYWADKGCGVYVSMRRL